MSSIALKEEKQLRKRELILNGSLIKAILVISLPILFYNLCNYLYGIYDMMIVSQANIGDTADIVVLDQIKNMLSTLGGALATGGGIYVARKFGEKNNIVAKKAANTLFTLALIIASITLLFIPLGIPLLKLLNTDQSTIDNAMGYYYIQIVILFVTTINNTFIALEKSKGNTIKLFSLNIGVIIIKIGLSTLFAFGPFENVTITWLAVATLIAQLFMMTVGLYFTFKKNNILRVTLKELNLSLDHVKIIFKLAIPVFVGRFLFSFGKVFINTMATSAYGKTCVGALGISNTIAGLMQNMVNSFEDGGSTIVSQNYGNHNGKRIKKFFIVNLIFLMSITVVGTLLLFLLRGNIAAFFAKDDLLYQEMIVNIFKWECLDIIFTGLSGAALAIFYGFGKTKITMSLSMANLFVFRIPTLLLLINVVHFNYEACGIAMFVSNTFIGVISIGLCIWFMFKISRSEKYKELFI